MDDKNVRNYRSSQRRLAFAERGGVRYAMCDICKAAPAQHYHELINRGRTVSNPEARRLSYQRELCAFLCPSCHEHAHNPNRRESLFKSLFERYGYDRVKTAFHALLRSLGADTDIIFPYTQGDNCRFQKKAEVNPFAIGWKKPCKDMQSTEKSQLGERQVNSQLTQSISRKGRPRSRPADE